MSEAPPVQRVAVALFEGFTVLDVYGPVQAFAACRAVQPDGKRRPFFEIFAMARERGRVKAGAGDWLRPADLPKADQEQFLELVNFWERIQLARQPAWRRNTDG